ncbi:hypothetical protein ACIRON_02680 [Nocardioides sp. NPDC101246]|uniref:hypothetical protein n=1 Tax=Nocardioides sp. NPDC101246 TaxID=3364336 RepID=UPI0037F1EEF9
MSASFTCDELVFLTTDEDDRAADAAQGWHFELLGDDWEMTSAEQAIDAIQSQLFDGEAIATGSYGNMPATLPIAIVGTDSARLAQGAAELMRVLRRPGMRSLTYIAPDGASPATVFDVLHARPVARLVDRDEMQIRRHYELTLACKPFPRSDTEIVADGEQIAAPSFTLVDNVNSSTAWSTQDPLRTGISSKAWSPARYNIATNGLVSDQIRSQGWTRGTNTVGFEWNTQTGTTGHITAWRSTVFETTSRLYVNSPRWTLRGTGALRLRLRMASEFNASFGVLYRWQNTTGTQIGADLTIAETTVDGDVAALITPPAGAVTVSIHPYARFLDANGKKRAWALRMVYLGPDGSSFWGNTTSTTSVAYDWTGTPFNSQSVELTPASLTPGTGQVSVTGYVHGDSRIELPLVRDADITPTTTSPYIVITGTLSPATSNPRMSLRMPTTGSFDQPVGTSPAVLTYGADGSFKAYFRATMMTTMSSVCLSLHSMGSNSTSTSVTMTATQVDLATSIPPIGTGRQGKFTLDVQGTMPAEASLQVANTGGVGTNVLIYTGPENPNFMPALSPSLVASGTADGATISNKKFTVPTSMAGTDTWQVSHVGLESSTYALFAKLTGSGLTTGAAYTFSTRQQTYYASGTPYGETATVTGKIIAPGTGYTDVAMIGVLRLPIVDTNHRPGGLEGLRLWVSGGTWTLDEAWLFDLVNGQLSHIKPFSGGYSNITIKAAAPDSPQQRYYTDDGGGSIRSQDARVQIWGNHRLDPATGCDVFAVCDTATPALSVSASYFPRWDMFAAPLSDDGNT